MRDYDKFAYIYPPRPEHKIPDSGLDTYDNGLYFGQPKLDGSCALVFIGPDVVFTYGRHKNEMVFRIEDVEFRDALWSGTGWDVHVGEYLNKNKADHTGEKFNHKFVLFDTIVYGGKYLLRSTFEERIALQNDAYGKASHSDFLYKISDNIFRVKTFTGDFKKVYDELIKHELFEGLVLKRRTAKLDMGRTEKNNTGSQLKCRRPTKNYKF